MIRLTTAKVPDRGNTKQVRGSRYVGRNKARNAGLGPEFHIFHTVALRVCMGSENWWVKAFESIIPMVRDSRVAAAVSNGWFAMAV